MTIKQVDSAIRFAEKVKTLTDRYEFSLKESETFKNLWQSEKENRLKDKADYQLIIDGYSAISTSDKAQIKLLTKKYKGQVRKARFMFVVSIAAIGFGVYSFLK